MRINNFTTNEALMIKCLFWVLEPIRNRRVKVSTAEVKGHLRNQSSCWFYLNIKLINVFLMFMNLWVKITEAEETLITKCLIFIVDSKKMWSINIMNSDHSVFYSVLTFDPEPSEMFQFSPLSSSLWPSHSSVSLVNHSQVIRVNM